MTQESALTRDEIEALDDEPGTLGFEQTTASEEPDAALDAREVRTQQPEGRSYRPSGNLLGSE